MLFSSELVHVSVTTWDKRTYTVLLPCVFDMDELLAALHTKSQTKRCAGCHVCKLQQSSMEVWTVTANGIGNVLCLLWLKSFCIKKGGKTILIQQMVLKNKRSPFEIAV